MLRFFIEFSLSQDAGACHIGVASMDIQVQYAESSTPRQHGHSNVLILKMTHMCAAKTKPWEASMILAAVAAGAGWWP